MRKLGWLGVFGSVVALAMYTGTPISGQQQLPRPYGTAPPLVITAFGGKPVTYKAPRTPWGDPDLQGVWSSDDMENVGIAGGGRGGRGARGGAPPAPAPAGPPPLYMDDAAFKARQEQVAKAATTRDTSAESSFRFDYGRRAFPQTRLLVDPQDGRMPAVLANVQNRLMPRGTYGPGPLNSWRDFSLYERCITRGIGGSVLRVIYGNGNRIVQSPGAVAFSYEMLPDTRIFHTDGRPHLDQKISQYLGDSRAHWEGEELVVETTNLTDLTAFGVNGNGTQHSKAMKITERFRRVADDIIQYQATWDDPLTYEAPFTVSFPLTPLDGGVLLPYECHPGNTAISMSLAGEREEDRRLAEDLAKGITRPRRTVQDCGAGVGAAPVPGVATHQPLQAAAAVAVARRTPAKTRSTGKDERQSRGSRSQAVGRTECDDRTGTNARTIRTPERSERPNDPNDPNERESERVRMYGMARAAYGVRATLMFVATIAGLVTVPVTAQSPIDVYELADYRLTTDVFERFVQANGRIVDVTQHDASFTDAPLFTRDVALSGDAVAEAAGLVARLTNHAGLTGALEAAKITPREYSKFAITLIAARLAHGFLKAGVLSRVPSGAPTINVEFVKTHEPDVTAALAYLGILD